MIDVLYMGQILKNDFSLSISVNILLLFKTKHFIMLLFSIKLLLFQLQLLNMLLCFHACRPTVYIFSSFYGFLLYLLTSKFLDIEEENGLDEGCCSPDSRKTWIGEKFVASIFKKNREIPT